MQTSENCRQLSLGEMLTSSPEDSPASHFPWRVNDGVQQITGISGRQCLQSLQQFSRVGLWQKTLLACLIGREGWSSSRCVLTWKLLATRYNRFYCRLQVSALPTEETGFGLLLTPTAQLSGVTLDQLIDKDGGPPRVGHRAYNRKTGKHAQIGILHQLQMLGGLLPTPKATVIEESPDRWKARRGKTDRQGKRPPGPPLDVALAQMITEQLLPTPTSRDWKGARTPDALAEAGRDESNSLPDYFSVATGRTFPLNPRFVGEMMGFPAHWTEFPFLAGERKV